MIIWKDRIPYIVNEIEDLKQVIDLEIFEEVAEFINGCIADSEVVSGLENELEQLESEISSLEDENNSLIDDVEELRESIVQSRKIEQLLDDFIGVIDVSKLSKDELYFLNMLLDARQEVNS